jgi:hypothetical protein
MNESDFHFQKHSRVIIMMRSFATSKWIATPILAVLLLGLSACQKEAAPVPADKKPASLLKPIAGVQDIMALMIDPAGDALWESVSTTTTKDGSHEHKPLTDKDWAAVRGHALTLIEASNLLVVDGRRVAREGVQQLEDHGTPGNLSAEESQKVIDANRETFVSFAHALRDVGEEMLKASEAKNADGLMEAGATMDQVCEGCHLKFWYPGQKIPLFPDQAPEEDLK